MSLVAIDGLQQGVHRRERPFEHLQERAFVIQQHSRYIELFVLDSRKPQQFPQLCRVEQVPGRAYINDLDQLHVSNA